MDPGEEIVSSPATTMNAPQLGKNIFAIASHHLAQPGRAADYFNQSLLEVPRNNEDGVTPSPVV